MNKSLILLLQVIRSEGSLAPLLSAGLEYVQIAQLLTRAKQEEYVLQSANKLALSSKGEQFLINSSKQCLQGGGWIRSLDEYRIAPLGKDEIYLPEQAPRL